jgi:hypothetical protein
MKNKPQAPVRTLEDIQKEERKRKAEQPPPPQTVSVQWAML